jgi:hypothetical protein
MDLGAVGWDGMDWIHLAQGRALVNTATKSSVAKRLLASQGLGSVELFCCSLWIREVDNQPFSRFI